MTHCRQIMLEELQRRNYAPTTISTYLHAVEQFARHFKCRPDRLNQTHFRSYQAYLLHERKMRPLTVRLHVAALRFFFVKTLKRRYLLDDTPYPKAPRRLPQILSVEEMGRVIDAADSLSHRTMLMVLYSTGMRKAELRHLQVEDIDSRRMLIHIQRGKGGRDRYVPLSPTLLTTMWEPYIGATRDGLPDGDQRIVFDRFHIMREMTKAVDTVRKQEHRGFLRAGDDSPLTGTKYLWLFSDERRPDHHAESFATLQALNLKVGRAWAIKEALRTLWTYRQGAAVKRFFAQWYGWAVRSRLDPVKKVAGMLKRHLDGVLRFVKHRITNGVAEGLNSKIMSIKRKAGGFRNPSNFTTAIYFHCGGLDLYPR